MIVCNLLGGWGAQISTLCQWWKSQSILLTRSKQLPISGPKHIYVIIYMLFYTAYLCSVCSIAYNIKDINYLWKVLKMFYALVSQSRFNSLQKNKQTYWQFSLIFKKCLIMCIIQSVYLFMIYCLSLFDLYTYFIRPSTQSYKGYSGQMERMEWSRKTLGGSVLNDIFQRQAPWAMAWCTPRSHLTGLLTWLNPMFLRARIWNHEMCNIYLASDQIFFWSDVVTTELKPVLRRNASPVPRLAHPSFHLKALVICLATQCILIISKSHFSSFSFPTTEICWECHNCFSF